MKTCVICGEGVGACEHTRAPTSSECLGVTVVEHPDMPDDTAYLIATSDELDAENLLFWEDFDSSKLPPMKVTRIDFMEDGSRREVEVARTPRPNPFVSEYQQQFPETDPRDWCVCGHHVDAHTPRGRPHDIRGCRYCDRCTVFRDRTRS